MRREGDLGEPIRPKTEVAPEERDKIEREMGRLKGIFERVLSREASAAAYHTLLDASLQRELLLIKAMAHPQVQAHFTYNGRDFIPKDQERFMGYIFPPTADVLGRFTESKVRELLTDAGGDVGYLINLLRAFLLGSIHEWIKDPLGYSDKGGMKRLLKDPTSLDAAADAYMQTLEHGEDGAVAKGYKAKLKAGEEI